MVILQKKTGLGCGYWKNPAIIISDVMSASHETGMQPRVTVIPYMENMESALNHPGEQNLPSDVCCRYGFPSAVLKVYLR